MLDMTLAHRGARTYFNDAVSDHAIDNRFRATLKGLAVRFVERANTLGLIGQRRDEAALDYWNGAASCAGLTGQTDLAEAIGKIGVLEITPRGFAAIADLAL